MEIKTIEKQVYITEDGLEFYDKDDAITHEGKQDCVKKLSYINNNKHGVKYYLVFNNDPIEVTNVLLDSAFFKMRNPDVVNTEEFDNASYFLIEDNNDKSIDVNFSGCNVYPISQETTKKLLGETKILPGATEQTENVISTCDNSQIKKQLQEILIRNTNSKNGWSPEMVLGNMIMEITDLIATI